MSAETKDSCLIRAKLLLTKFKHQEPGLLVKNTLIKTKMSSEGTCDDNAETIKTLQRPCTQSFSFGSNEGNIKGLRRVLESALKLSREGVSEGRS